MNLGQAADSLGDRGFSYLSAPRRYEMLNRALTDIEDFWPWPWLRKTATGAAPLEISDLKYVRSVRDTSTNQAGPLWGLDDADDFDITQTGTSASGWWIDETGGTPVLRVYPVATTNLMVRYVAESSELDDATDTPSLPKRYHGLWVDQAVVFAYQDSDNFAAAAQLQQQINQRLQQLVERYETRDRQSGDQILLRAVSEDD